MDRRLQRELIFLTDVEPTAGVDVLPFRVLTQDDEVDLLRSLVRQNALHAGGQLDRADAGVLLERLANLHERRERQMIGDFFRPTDGPEQDRIERTEHRQQIVRRAFAGLSPIFITPRQPRVFQVEIARLLFDGIDHADRFVDDLGTDAVARIERDAEGFHGVGFHISCGCSSAAVEFLC